MAPRSYLFGLLFLAIAIGLAGGLTAGNHNGPEQAPARWRQHDHNRPGPPVVEPIDTPASAPPAPPRDAVVLFDGKNLDDWETPEGAPAAWSVRDGHFQVTPGAGPIQTRDRFGDVQLHVEWASPDPPAGKGQDRGNSGIFLMGRFELQILDSYRAETYTDGQAGAIYGQYPPLFNASRPPGQWQTYDIAFRRPRFDRAGRLQEPARMTVVLNGILVQNNEELWGQTNWLEPTPFDPSVDRGPIQLQDHGHPVRFRNIWVRNLPERAAPRAEDLRRPPTLKLAPELLDAVAGEYEEGPEPHRTRIAIRREGETLKLVLPHRPTPLLIEPVSETRFLLPHTDAGLTFEKDAGGAVNVVRFQVGDAEKRLSRTRARP